ncbi:ComEC/Rec2 family competence protein [Liquorilactobacillus uvarum]|uniref:ComEC/Rec2 family competence protein n=1 Tax=Liquorilactobacillus uvarum TaxID=303240 RepID=UPI002889BD24|nr:ComEC/Rec2 family competence protein [Liquorilactobacillus uvarum]
MLWNKSLQQKAFKDKVEITKNEIILEPDEFQIDGDLLKLSGFWIEGNQKIQAYYNIGTKNEKKHLSKIDTIKTLVVTANVEQILPPTNENQFDYRTFMRGKKIVNTAQISKLEVGDEAPHQGAIADLIAATHGLRKRILNYFAALPAPLNGYSQILLLGYYSQNFSTQLEQINKLGLLHLFSLSGMHIFYILSAIRFVLGYMHITRETCEDLILIILPFYAILGGLSSSLIRAVMMSWLMILSSKFFDNGLDGVEAEAVVLLLNLLYSPELVHSMGAQLSYLLTFVLMMSKKMNVWQLGLKMNGYSVPLILWHTFRWNMLTTVTSILIIPVFEWIIIPSVLLGVLFPQLSFLCNEILFWIAKGIEVTAKLPSNIVFGKPPLAIVIFWLGLMFALEVVKSKKKIYFWKFVSYLLVGIMIKMPLHDEIVFLDIGQGDCTLIRRRFNREITLIDTGGKISFQNKQWQKRHSKENGETVVANYLLSKGVSKVNWLFLTHQDTDHVGNFPVISRLVKIEKILVPSGMEKTASFERRLLLSANKKQDVVPISTEKVE